MRSYLVTTVERVTRVYVLEAPSGKDARAVIETILQTGLLPDDVELETEWLRGGSVEKVLVNRPRNYVSARRGRCYR